MTKINNPYLTIINAKTKYNPEEFKNFEYDEISVAKGDRGKTSTFIETNAHIAFKKAVEELNSLNIPSTLNSAGRDFEDQQYAIDEFYRKELSENGNNEEQARTETDEYCAKVGYSEHHSGLALDIIGPTGNAIIPDKIKEKYSDEKYAKVLGFITKRLVMEKYGFILTYPASSRLEQATGMKHPESWHWRYVGPEHSQTIARIRERVTEDIDERKTDNTIVFQEVFLEDYIQLLQYETAVSSQEELIEQYAELFKTKILGLEKQNKEEASF